MKKMMGSQCDAVDSPVVCVSREEVLHELN